MSVEIPIAASMPEVNSLGRSMVSGEIPVFQVAEDTTRSLGLLEVIASIEENVRAVAGSHFRFNDFLASHSGGFGPHYHEGFSGVTLHKNLLGEATLKAAFRGNYIQSMDFYDPGDPEHTDPLVPIERIRGLGTPLYQGHVTPGILTVLAERIVDETEQEI